VLGLFCLHSNTIGWSDHLTSTIRRYAETIGWVCLGFRIRAYGQDLGSVTVEVGWWWGHMSGRSFKVGQAVRFQVCVDSWLYRRDHRSRKCPLLWGQGQMRGLREACRCHVAVLPVNMFEEMVSLMSPLSPEADGLCDWLVHLYIPQLFTPSFSPPPLFLYVQWMLCVYYMI